MLELRQVLAEVSKRVSDTAGDRIRWRLTVIGSAAAGETTQSTDNVGTRWRSDVELYLQSPDAGLESVLIDCRNALECFPGPRIDISGGDPRTVESFRPKQWLIDAGKVGRKLSGVGDAWPDPFQVFAKLEPSPEDALVLLSNRCAEYMDPCKDSDYALLKCVLDFSSAGLILSGAYRSTVRGRMQQLANPTVRRDCIEAGMDPALPACAALAALWKLDGSDSSREAFVAVRDAALAAVRASLPGMVATACSGSPEGGLKQLESWLEGRAIRELVRDWGRGVARSPWSALLAFFPLRWGPIWSVRYEALKAMESWMDTVDTGMTHRRWQSFAKGI